jgi:cardiolipin synthase
MAWERELDRLTGEKQSAGKIRYLVDGEAFFPRFVDAVASARASVHIRLYIFDNDDVALRIADLLRRRSQEIDVKVLLDGLGTYGAAAASPDYSPRAQPRDRSIDAYLMQDSKVHVRILSNPWLTGDHTKSIIVDDRLAFIGGMNIGREYRYEWHDLMVELTGPVVDTLRTDFHKTWTQQTFLGDLRRWMARVKPVNAAAPDDYPIRILVTAPQKPQILQTQLAAIRRAQRRIYIQNAYFTSDAILYELAAARRRGVDVRVIIPYRNDSGVINRSNAMAANAMLANGIRVYIYPGMSHLKGAVYDGWACLGSANFDSLSFAVNKELNIATSHGPAVEEFVARVFAPDFAKSVELTQPFPGQWWDFLNELLADRL